MSYVLVTIGDQLGWLKLLWQPFTLYLSDFGFVFANVVEIIIIIFFFFFFYHAPLAATEHKSVQIKPVTL